MKLNRKLTSIMLSAAMALTALPAATATAAPTIPNVAAPATAASLNVTQAGADIQTVQYRGERHYRGDRGYRGDRRHHWRGGRRGHRDGFHWRGERPYYGDHRGYRERRRNYRRHNGFWFPSAAFTFGTVIRRSDHRDHYRGPARDYRRGSLSPRHYAWCDRRYKTYRASDNTYVPRIGQRAYCNSPYS